MGLATRQLIRLENRDKIPRLIEALQDYVVKGGHKPGTEIPAERPLASQLGVSRFSLREALRAVEAQGLITISQGRRPRVAAPSASAAAQVIALTLLRSGDPLLDLIEARQVLECAIARLAALRAKPIHVDALRRTTLDMENHKKDLLLCAERDIEFHNVLVDATGNGVFRIMLAPLTKLLRKSRLETMRLKGVERAVSGHKTILLAVMEKDADRAAKAMRRHLRMAEEDLKIIGGLKYD